MCTIWSQYFVDQQEVPPLETRQNMYVAFTSLPVSCPLDQSEHRILSRDQVLTNHRACYSVIVHLRPLFLIPELQWQWWHALCFDDIEIVCNEINGQHEYSCTCFRWFQTHWASVYYNLIWSTEILIESKTRPYGCLFCIGQKLFNWPEKDSKQVVDYHNVNKIMQEFNKKVVSWFLVDSSLSVSCLWSVSLKRETLNTEYNWIEQKVIVSNGWRHLCFSTIGPLTLTTTLASAR